MSRDRHQVKVLQSQMENVGARARTISAAAKACRRRSGGRGCPSVASHTRRSRPCVITSWARRYAARDLTGPVPARRPSLLAAQGRRPFVTPGCTRNMTMPILNPAFAVLGRLCPRKAGEYFVQAPLSRGGAAPPVTAPGKAVASEVRSHLSAGHEDGPEREGREGTGATPRSGDDVVELRHLLLDGGGHEVGE